MTITSILDRTSISSNRTSVRLTLSACNYLPILHIDCRLHLSRPIHRSVYRRAPWVPNSGQRGPKSSAALLMLHAVWSAAKSETAPSVKLLFSQLCLDKKSLPSQPLPSPLLLSRNASCLPDSTMAAAAGKVKTEEAPAQRPASAAKKIHYPFWFGGSASCFAAGVTHPLDLGKFVKALVCGRRWCANSIVL